MRSKGWSLPAHASIGYIIRGLADAPSPEGEGRRESAQPQGVDGMDDVVEMSDELRWISLVSSGDPIIHMWIKGQGSKIKDHTAMKSGTRDWALLHV